MTQPFGATSTTDDVLAGVSLHGKRAFVTGVSAGIGEERPARCGDIWAAAVAPAASIGGRYCEDCHVAEIVPDDVKISSAVREGVRAYALDPKHAQALWAKSEEMVGEHF